MALFKCLRSGNTVEIFQEDDVERMKDHEGYIRLDVPQPKGDDHEVSVAKNAEAQTDQNAEAEVTVSVTEPVITDVVAAPVKKRGRPRAVPVAEVASEGVEV